MEKMDEREVMHCPKCRGEMERGSRLRSYGSVTFAKNGDLWGDRIIPFYCRKCGYIELYKEMKR